MNHVAACCWKLTLGLAATLVCSVHASAQQRFTKFELVDAAGVVSATVVVSPGQLIAYEANGERVIYTRAPQYDSPDRRFVGYYQLALNRILRFPRSGRGAMQGVDLDQPFARYQYLSRSVRPMLGFQVTPSLYLPPTTYGAPFQGLGVGGGPYGGAPVGWTGTGVGLANGQPFIGNGFPQQAGGFPLGGAAVGAVPFGVPGQGFGPRQGFGPGQGFGPRQGVLRPRGIGVPRRAAARSVLLDSQLVPRPELPAVPVKLVNTHQRELRVTVADLNHEALTKQYRIAPGGSRTVTLRRDAGADQVEHYQTVTFEGAIVTREIVRPVPPQVLYEIIVHEWAIQSISIDRTGKNPKPVDDIQFQGRGIGRFPIPPGDRMTSTAIDVFREAKRANNPGGVSPIVEPRLDASRDSGLSPLERAVLEQQRAVERARGGR